MSKGIAEQVLSILSIKPFTNKSKILSLLTISTTALKPRDIEKSLQLPKGTVTGTLSSLYKNGLITRVKKGYIPTVTLFDLVLYVGQRSLKQELKLKKKS